MPVKIKHKQLGDIKEVSYNEYFHNINKSLWSVLKIWDIGELYNSDTGVERWQATIELHDAKEALKKHPNIFRYEYSKLNSDPEPLAKPIQDRVYVVEEKKDFVLDFLKTLFEAGINNKIDVTKTLEEYFPLEKYSNEDNLSQDLAIKHFLHQLREDKLIKYDTLIMKNGLGEPYIDKWDAVITKDAIDFYLRLSENSSNKPPKTHETTHPINNSYEEIKSTNIFKKTLKLINENIWLATIIGGVIVYLIIVILSKKGVRP